MSENLENNTEITTYPVSRKFAVFVNNNLVMINNCDDRTAAILNSNPRFEEIVND
jgi:hypothetical protein